MALTLQNILESTSRDKTKRVLKGALGAVLLLWGLQGFAEEAEAVSPPETTEEEETERALSVEEVLSQTLGEDAYVETKRCISTRLIRSVKALDEKHIVFDMGRDKRFLVQLRHRCPGLRPGRPIAFESNQGRLCRLDRVRGVDIGMGAASGATCSLDIFQSITKEQVTALRDAIKAERRAARG